MSLEALQASMSRGPDSRAACQFLRGLPMLGPALHGAVQRILLSDHDVVVRIPSGISQGMPIRLDPRGNGDDARSFCGSWMQEVVAQLLRPGDTFCDVGARIGSFSLGAARLVGESGSVVALEPDRDSFWRLVHNVGLNGLVHVKTLNFAAQGSARNRDLIRSGTPGSPDESDASAVLPVQAGRLDDILMRPPDLIKVDVGGSEVDVLAGAGALLRKRRSIWLIEAHGASRLSEVVALLSSFRYAPRVVAEEACPAGKDRYFVVARP